MSEITHLKAEETKITDYERGIEQASTIYKGVIRGYKAENAKLRELVRDMWNEGAFAPGACYVETDRLEDRTRELGVEVDE